jgi:hypothetical protein
MSLTKFIKLKEVKEKFEEFFPIKPTLDVKKEILAKPYTNNYSLVECRKRILHYIVSSPGNT